MKPGDKVRDTITGFSGTVVCRTEWLNGCVRFGIQAPALHEGKPVDLQYIDAEQLELVELAPARVARSSGGDRQDPKRAPDPRR